MSRISVVIPVRNEASNIKNLLDGLLAQTKKPDEIVITDGGSNDKTVAIIQEYAEHNPFIKLICLPQAFPGKGRNTAIEHASHDIIGSIDAGCKPQQNWLEELVKPFERDPSVDVVFGRYIPCPKTLLERCFVLATEPVVFSPSAASMAHKKEVWRKVGGYSEELCSSEDTIFKSKLVSGGFKIENNPKAIVEWLPRSTFSAFFRQFYGQSKTSSCLGLRRSFYLRKTAFILMIVFLLMLAIFQKPVLIFFAIGLYLTWMGFTIVKHYAWFRDIQGYPQAYLLLPFVFMLRDIAQISGFLAGFVNKIPKRIERHEGVW